MWQSMGLAMPKILIVDDEPVSLELMGLSLSDEGYSVRRAASGTKGIDIGREFVPDVLVSDWRLGEKIDGIELARVLQQENPEMRIIFVSGLPSQELRDKAEGLAIAEVLEKPVDLDAISGAIAKALSVPE